MHRPSCGLALLVDERLVARRVSDVLTTPLDPETGGKDDARPEPEGALARVVPDHTSGGAWGGAS